MKAKLERLEGNEVALEIEVGPEKVEEALQRAYRKVVNRVNIPGFRRGKAPRPVVEAFVGKEALYEEALEEVIPEAYNEAVEETRIEPVSQPKIDVVQMEDGKSLIFKANVVVKPEPKLGQLTGITVKVPKIKVTDQDVEERLEVMRNRYARLDKVEDSEPAAMGDVLTIDFTGYIGDEPFPGGSGQDYSLELGSGTFIPGFEEQLVGMKAGEGKSITVTFPEDYHAEDMRGVEARFEVKVKEIKRRVLSPLNDEFAKDVSEFETLEELRQDIRRELEEVARKNQEQLAKSKVIAKVVEDAEVDIPQEMIDTQIDYQVRQFAQQLAYQGMYLEDYLKVTGKTFDEFKEEFQKNAEQVVRNNLVLEAVAKQLNLEVTEEEFREQVEKVARQMGMQAGDVADKLEDSRARIEFGILMDKAVDYLYANATIIETEENSEESTVDG